MPATLYQPPSGHYCCDAVVIPVHDRRKQPKTDAFKSTGCASSGKDDPRVSAPANKLMRVQSSVPTPHATGSSGNASSAALKRRRAVRSSAEILDREMQHALIARFVKAGGRITQKQLAEAQRRYVKKPETLLFLLMKDIQDIRGQVETLKEQLSVAVALGNKLQCIAAEYFRLIRHGYVTGITGNLLGFLIKVSAPDVMFNMEYGPEAIEQHWCLTQWFGNVGVEVESFQKSPYHSLVAFTVTKVTITRETLRNVFPHLRTTDNSDRNCTLVEQLLNQRLVMRGATYFDWDDSTCRLTRVLAQNDMLTPMLTLLGNMEDVARVFHKALVSSEFEWRTL